MPSQLMRDIAAMPNLFLAWKKVKAYLRRHAWYYDPLETELFECDLENRLHDISHRLLDAAYSPAPARLVPVPKRVDRAKDGTVVGYSDRPLADCANEDQLVWVALINCTADRFEDDFLDADPDSGSNLSYGNRLYRVQARPGAFTFVQTNSKLYRQFFVDYSHFLKRSLAETEMRRLSGPVDLFDLDVKGFYNNIETSRLAELIGMKIQDEDVRSLVERLLLGWELRDTSDNDVRGAGRGIPQGLAASGFLANIYLNPLDHWARGQMGESKARLLYYARYVDDIRVVVRRQGRTSDQPGPVRALQQFVGDLGLQINENKTEKVWSGDKSSQPIREDQLATRVSQVGWRASHLIAQSEAREVFAELETLLYLDFDNVAMRRDSRMRFCANRMAWVDREFHDVDTPFWDQKASRLREWLLDEWRADPSQRTLLVRLVEMTADAEMSRLVQSVLTTLSGLKDPDGGGPLVTWQWYLRTCLYQALHDRCTSRDSTPQFLKGKRLRDAVVADLASGRPWYVRRAAYRLASLWPESGRSTLARAVQADLHASSDALVRTACLNCLYSWLGQSARTRLLERGDADAADVLLFGRQAQRDGLLARDGVRALARVAGGGSRQMARATEVVTGLLAETLLPGDLARLALAGVERARVEVTLRSGQVSDWGPMGKALTSSAWFAELAQARADGFASLAQASLEGRFVDEMALAEMLSGLAAFLGLERPPDRPSAGVLHPGNIHLKCAAEDSDRHYEFRLVPAAQDERYVDPAVLMPEYSAVDHGMCWWHCGFALTAVCAVRGATSPDRDYSMPTKFSAWLSHSNLAKEDVQVSSWTAGLLGDLLSWHVDSRVHLTASVVSERLRTAVGNLRGLRVGRPDGPDAQVTPVRLHSSGCATIRVGLVQVDVAPSDVLSGRFPAQTSERLQNDIRRLVRIALERGEQLRGGGPGRYWDDPPIHLLVLPELSCPRSCLPLLRSWSLKYRMCIAAGLEYEESTDCRLNEMVIFIPVTRNRAGDCRDLVTLRQRKLFPTGEEMRCAQASGLEVAPGLQQFLIEDADIAAWAVVNCYDFTCIELRDKLRGATDLLVVSSLNRDTTTFDLLSEASIRDLHSYLLLANTGSFGGSQILGPFYGEHARCLYKVQGQRLATCEVREIRIGGERGLRQAQIHALRTGQMPAAPGKNEPEFKALPAGYRMSGFRRGG